MTHRNEIEFEKMANFSEMRDLCGGKNWIGERRGKSKSGLDLDVGVEEEDEEMS